MCRSPLAERIARLHYPQHHWESAGVMPQGWMHPLSQRVLKELGADCENFMARHVNELELNCFDHIVLIGDGAQLHTKDSPPDIKRHFWDVTDPYVSEGSREQLEVYRACAMRLGELIDDFMNEYEEHTC
jgi:protein-tyrosine-phosphatase